MDRIIAAEAAAEAQKNSWGAWLSSPLSKKVEETEEERDRKDRERQVRRGEKDMKERRLEPKIADLKKEESRLQKSQEEVDAADLVDTRRIQVIQDRIWAREEKERQQERERQDEKERQKEKERHEEQKRQERQNRQEEERAEREKRNDSETATRGAATGSSRGAAKKGTDHDMDE